VAKEIKQRDDVKAVKVVGHTDTSGPEDYNMELSLRRARAVRDALAERGIPRDMIEIDNKGEKELLVPTPDSVREPANRRAKITFEERRQRAGR
jgi:outer membrane protein OmpA-like peptidoglycan-associated protein